MNPISPPYLAHPETLSHPLPTLDEIHHSKDVIYERGGCKIVGIGPYAVKYGAQVELIEGENMLFVARSTSVAVPRVYGLFKDDTNEVGYIIMERIAGKSLKSEWPLLSDVQKGAIIVKLAGYVKELRSLPSPGAYCSIGNRPLLDYLFWNADTPEKINGPFDTEEELNKSMLKKYMFNNGSRNKAEFYKERFPSILRDHPPRFTHGDFQRKNITLRSVGDAESDVDLVLLDWEFAGWYPSYWEYSRAVYACGRWDDDWCLAVNKIFAPELYSNEWAWMNMLLLELWS